MKLSLISNADDAFHFSTFTHPDMYYVDDREILCYRKFAQ